MNLTLVRRLSKRSWVGLAAGILVACTLMPMLPMASTLAAAPENSGGDPTDPGEAIETPKSRILRRVDYNRERLEQAHANGRTQGQVVRKGRKEVKLFAGEFNNIHRRVRMNHTEFLTRNGRRILSWFDEGRTNDQGWTIFEPSPDSLIFYVSSSQGSDSNDGLSPESPFKTLDYARRKLRNGYPDWMLLKSGDTWNESLKSSGSGRSREEFRLYGSYGDDPRRPTISPSRTEDGFMIGASADSYIAIVGIQFLAPAGGSEKTGIRIIDDGGEGFLIEDCMVSGFKDNITLIGKEASGKLREVIVRRCIVVDSCAPFGGHSQGLYAEAVDDLLVDECIFDRNGWNPDLPDCGATMFNHNLYIQSTCGPAAVRNTISARASSHGLQMRPGGLVEGNLFVGNSLGMYVSRSESVVSRNVVLEGKDIDSDNPRGFGIETLSCVNAIVVDNIVAHRSSKAVGGYAYQVNKSDNGVEYYRATFEGNIAYNWGEQAFRVHISDNTEYDEILVHNNIFQDPSGVGPLVSHVPAVFDPQRFDYQDNTYYSGNSPQGWMSQGNSRKSYNEWLQISGERGSQNREVAFPDPDRSVGEYHSKIGGRPTTEDFLANARKLSRANWDPAFTAPAVVDWIRAGFGRD